MVVLAGDGGTFDIGLQSLSGAASRGENIIYVCNNNGAYMNTGIQTSTATPYGAVTTTNPNPNYKKTWPKDLMGIITSHNIPYAATVSLAYMQDFRRKVEKAKHTNGFRFLMIDGPCPPGHKTDPSQSISIARLAVETKLFPLFEVEHHRVKINYYPKKDIPAAECLKLQGRFRHLFKEGAEEALKEIQAQVDSNWQRLLKLEEISYQF